MNLGPKDDRNTLVEMTDEEMVNSITITLAAHSEQFPQLKGKGVGPETRDDRRHRFARRLVKHLRLSDIRFIREATNYLGAGTGAFTNRESRDV